MYIGDYLGRREIYSPDKLAIIDYGKSPEWRLTYRQWNERVKRLAKLILLQKITRFNPCLQWSVLAADFEVGYNFANLQA